MRYLGIAAGIFGAEHMIKEYVEKHFTDQTRIRPGGKGIVLQKYHNRGACLNLGEKKPFLVALLSVLLTLAAFVYLLCNLGQRGNALLKTGLGILLGGAFSNTYDRVFRRYVVDYFSFHTGWKALDRIVFNLADFAVLTGAVITALAVSPQ